MATRHGRMKDINSDSDEFVNFMTIQGHPVEVLLSFWFIPALDTANNL